MRKENPQNPLGDQTLVSFQREKHLSSGLLFSAGCPVQQRYL